MKRSSLLVVIIATMLCISPVFTSCNDWNADQQTSDSGVKKATVSIKTDAQGHTTEQKNIMQKNVKDNEIGAVKHLYVVSCYTGDVMEYSTVVGKVTSGNKRLSPKTVNGDRVSVQGATNWVTINGDNYITDEVIDESGSYGDSGNYLYWFDAQSNYHQYYPSGGTYLHISDKPLRVRKSNMSITLD